MRTIGLLLGVAMWAAGAPPSPEVQIASAVQAAPADMRDGAAVLGYNAAGELTTLREGKNSIVCLASDPNRTAYSVACYHKDLEPFMKRGRELTKQKIGGQQRNEMRWKEIAEGKLAMPREPRILYVLSGTGFDSSTGKIESASLRSVIYVPYATSESTGLSTKPVEGGGPWLMFAGTAGAHIMISPGKN